MGEATPCAGEPLIFTSRGNLPESSLSYATDWKVGEHVIQFTETYRLGDEIVKQSVHVYDRTGVTGSGVAASF